jgi:YopT-type cysteine protease-like protein
MPKPTFDKIEDSGGEVIHAESQNKLVDEMAIGTISDNAVANGVCKALCARWISSSVQNSDFWETLHQPGNRETVRLLHHKEAAAGKMMAAALKTSDIHGNFDRKQTNDALMVESVKKMMGQQGSADVAIAEQESNRLRDGWASEYINRNTGLHAPPLQAVKPDELVNKLAEGTGYYLFGIDCAKGGHAMALYNMPGIGVQYFDPNFGEAVFTDTAQFKRWMTKHLANYSDELGNISGSKFTFVERKSAPDRTDTKQWEADHAGEQRGGIPPVHWPAWESAKAKQAKRQAAEEEKLAEHMASLGIAFGQGEPQPMAGGPRDRGNRKGNRGAMVLQAGGGNPLNPPQAEPTTAPTTTQPHTAPTKAEKKSWRKGGGVHHNGPV